MEGHGTCQRPRTASCRTCNRRGRLAASTSLLLLSLLWPTVAPVAHAAGSEATAYVTQSGDCGPVAPQVSARVLRPKF